MRGGWDNVTRPRCPASLVNEDLEIDVINEGQAKELINDYKRTGSLNDVMTEAYISSENTNSEEEEHMSKYMEDALLQVAESQSVAIPAYSMYGDLLGYYYIDML